jgi:hypothetical protein
MGWPIQTPKFKVIFRWDTIIRTPESSGNNRSCQMLNSILNDSIERRFASREPFAGELENWYRESM